MNSRQKHNIEQLLFTMEMACFDAVFDILKFQDASTLHFQVQFFNKDSSFSRSVILFQ